MYSLFDVAKVKLLIKREQEKRVKEKIVGFLFKSLAVSKKSSTFAADLRPKGLGKVTPRRLSASR